MFKFDVCLLIKNAKYEFLLELYLFLNLHELFCKFSSPVKNNKHMKTTLFILTHSGCQQREKTCRQMSFACFCPVLLSVFRGKMRPENAFSLPLLNPIGVFRCYGQFKSRKMNLMLKISIYRRIYIHH